jgi:hypothetical protein
MSCQEKTQKRVVSSSGAAPNGAAFFVEEGGVRMPEDVVAQLVSGLDEIKRTLKEISSCLAQITTQIALHERRIETLEREQRKQGGTTNDDRGDPIDSRNMHHAGRASGVEQGQARTVGSLTAKAGEQDGGERRDGGVGSCGGRNRRRRDRQDVF